VLDGRRATTHWWTLDLLRDSFPAITVERHEHVVEDGNVQTSAGISAGIDMALRVVARYHGEAVARAAARYMEYPFPESNARGAQRRAAAARRGGGIRAPFYPPPPGTPRPPPFPLQRRLGPPGHGAVRSRRAAQAEHARGQVAVAPRRRHVGVVLQHRRAELV